MTTPQVGFSGPMQTNSETNISNENSIVKNPSLQEVDRLAIYKPDRGVEFRTTENKSS